MVGIFFCLYIEKVLQTSLKYVIIIIERVKRIGEILDKLLLIWYNSIREDGKGGQQMNKEKILIGEEYFSKDELEKGYANRNSRHATGTSCSKCGEKVANFWDNGKEKLCDKCFNN